MMKNVRAGFTLAEVLTTLMVIGVVAAMTIPTLLNSTNEQQQRVAYKKAMSVLSQGIQLMTAREDECTVQSDHDLAVCMQEVISGTLYDWVDSDHMNVNAANGDGNIIVSSDGMAYAFYYNNANNDPNVAVDRSLDDICGTSTEMFLNTENDYDGTNSRCIVIVDTNGPSKGSHSFSATAGAGNMAHHAIVEADLQGSDQAALLVTGGGVRPIYNNNLANNSRVNAGYGYVFGEGAAPFENAEE